MAPRLGRQSGRTRGSDRGGHRCVRRLTDAWGGLAGEEWPTRREELLASLRDEDTTQRTARRHVEIFLYAEEYEAAIDIADRFSDYEVVEPVVEDLRDEHYRKYKLRPMLEDLLDVFSE